ncbi:MAG: Flp family type IVb pilin [Planctomyces sp.]|nr:Flp family type IVb pilin [Planctomyces sp.]
MTHFVKAVSSFLRSEDGPTAVEYAVMLAMIIIVCIAGVSTLGSNTSTHFTDVSDFIT